MWIQSLLQQQEGIKQEVSTAQTLSNQHKKRSDMLFDLVAQLKKRRIEGDRIILAMDANEHIYNKSLGKELTDAE